MSSLIGEPRADETGADAGIHRPLVSVVVPIFNDEQLVAACHAALSPVLDQVEGETEVVYVDDGSTDHSVDALRTVQSADARVRIVELAGNFGQHAALSAGFEQARGEYLVALDADLQCDPADIPRLLEPLRRGYDLVSGVRINRKDPVMRRTFSRLTTSFVNRFSGVALKDIGCPANALTRDLARSLTGFGEARRFLKPLAVRVARNVAEVEINHRPRSAGKSASSYSATALVRLLMDFIVGAVSDVFAWIFLIATACTLLLIAGAVAALLVTALTPVAAGVTSLVLLLLGFQSFLLAILGLAGDYLQRIYRQSSGRPFFVIRRLHEPGGRR